MEKQSTKDKGLKRNSTTDWVLLFIVSVIIPIGAWIITIIHWIQMYKGTREDKGKALYILIDIVGFLIALMLLAIL